MEGDISPLRRLLFITDMSLSSPLSTLASFVYQSPLRWQVRLLIPSVDTAALDKELAPDLLLVQLPNKAAAIENVFRYSKGFWPQTHLVLCSTSAADSAAELIRAYGSMPVLIGSTPEELVPQIEQELAQISFGSVPSFSLPNVLQIMQWDKKSLALLVRNDRDWGRLHLYQGELVDAYVHSSSAEGEQAALEILGWEKGALVLERSYHNQRRSIKRELTHLLLEAGRRKDEEAKSKVAAALLESGSIEDNMFFKRSKRTEDLALQEVIEVPSLNIQEIPEEPMSLILTDEEGIDMQNVKTTLDSALSTIDGAIAIALVDYTSGMMLGSAGSGINLEVAAAGNTEVVRAKLRTMENLGIKGNIEDILITLDDQYHIVYLVPAQKLFMYLVLTKDRANLAMARYKLRNLVTEMEL